MIFKKIKRNGDTVSVEFNEKIRGHDEYYSLRAVDVKGSWQTMDIDKETLLLLKLAIDEILR